MQEPVGVVFLFRVLGYGICAGHARYRDTEPRDSTMRGSHFFLRGSGTCDWAHAMGIWNGLVCHLVLDGFNLNFCVCYFWTSRYIFWLDPGYLNVFFATFFWRREIFESPLENLLAKNLKYFPNISATFKVHRSNPLWCGAC